MATGMVYCREGGGGGAVARGKVRGGDGRESGGGDQSGGGGIGEDKATRGVATHGDGPEVGCEQEHLQPMVQWDQVTGREESGEDCQDLSGLGGQGHGEGVGCHGVE